MPSPASPEAPDRAAALPSGEANARAEAALRSESGPVAAEPAAAGELTARIDATLPTGADALRALSVPAASPQDPTDTGRGIPPSEAPAAQGDPAEADMLADVLWLDRAQDAYRITQTLLSSGATPLASSLPQQGVPTAVQLRIPATRDDLERLRSGIAERPGLPPLPLRDWIRPDGTPVDSVGDFEEALQVRYSLHPELSDTILTFLERQKVALGQVVVADARTGRLLAYSVTDPKRFGPDRLYPAASLAKVVTAAAVLGSTPDVFERPCVFNGSPYRLTRDRLRPPRRGNRITHLRALATSNNQCFGRLAVDQLGAGGLRDAFDSFGWLGAPVPGFPAGRIQPTEDAYELAQLGSGLAGSSITPLHAIQLALSLVDGTVPTPYWIDSVVDSHGNARALPPRRPAQRVMQPRVAHRLREMLVETTRRGTARRAFHRRNGRPLLQDVKVAGKTGSLSGTDPTGRYEWFVGVAPADDPRVAIAVVSVHGDFFLQTSSQLAAEVLRQVFCPKGVCSPEAAERWTSVLDPDGAFANDVTVVAPIPRPKNLLGHEN